MESKNHRPLPFPACEELLNLHWYVVTYSVCLFVKNTLSEKSGAVPTLQTPYKQRPHPASPGSARDFHSDGLLTLPAQYVEQGLCNGRAPVRPSDRSTAAPVAGERSAGRRYKSIAAGAVQAPALSSKCG